MQLPGGGYQAWIYHKTHGILPRAGGWLDQPIALTAQDQAIEMTVNLHRKMRDDSFDWRTLSRNEVELTRWIGLEDGR